jgi:beta-lactamase class D
MLTLCGASLLLLNGAGAAPAPAPPHHCMVIRDQQAGTTWRSDEAACATRLAPASTFKIPHALVALETGVITPDTVEKWDGTKYPNFPLWQRDQTVVSAMRPSVLWFFQRIAPRVGAARMHDWLTKLHYGNASTAGDVTRYWINGTLRVSPDEQVAFLQSLHGDRPPFARERIDLILGALAQPAAAIENANGVTRLEVAKAAWPKDAAWRAKTGRTEFDGRRVNWLVGDLRVGKRSHLFASAVWRDNAEIGAVDAAQRALNTFVERGLLKPAK